LQHSASAPELHDIDLKDSELPDRQQQSTPFDDLVQRSVTPTGEEYERKLPCISSNRISPSTLAAVLEGRYDQQYDRMCVVDCRFDYEFRGGHVRNAISVTEPDQLEAMFFPPDQTQQLMDVRTLVVFHCEFSQVRGPKQMEHLRLLDRTRVGYDRHPLLNYPEVYLLDGGYKRFFLEYPQLCEPRAYVTMDSDDRSGRLMSHCHQLWRSRSASSTPVRGSRSFTQPDAVPSFQPGAGQVRSFQRSQSCRGLMDSDKFAAAAAGTDKMQLSFMSIPSNATSLSIPFTRSAPLPVSSPLPIFSAPTAVPSVRHVPTAFASPTPAPVSAPGLTPAPAPATPQSDSLNSSFSSAAFPSPLPSPSTAAAAAFMQQVASPSDSSSPVSSMESPVGFSNFTPVQKVLEQPSVDDPMEDESSHDAIFCAKLAFHAE
jgi:rhodanese-related sulfurtransferase